jgi:hypothetical protein
MGSRRIRDGAVTHRRLCSGYAGHGTLVFWSSGAGPVRLVIKIQHRLGIEPDTSRQNAPVLACRAGKQALVRLEHQAPMLTRRRGEHRLDEQGSISKPLGRYV